MKSASDPLKSLKPPAFATACAEAIAVAQTLRRERQVKYMIDNQYHATRSILQEQNEMFGNKRSTDENDISEFFDSQIDANSELMRYLCELRDCLTQAIETPLELPYILNSLGEEACKVSNEWILDMFSEVIECMEQLRRPSTIDHSSSIEARVKNVLKAA